MIIPSLAYHLDRSISDKGLIVNKQDHLNPIFSLSNKNNPSSLEELLKKHFSFQQLISSDLFLVPLEKASFSGASNEFISSYRLDNLSSAFACLFGLIEAKPSNHTLELAIFWDHEEVGSKSYLGAESFFLNETLERIAMIEKMDREDYFRMKSNSYCVSVDLAHGYNPNYSERYDMQNASYLGKGIVVKTNGMLRYATNASNMAPLIQIANQKKLPLQKSAFRSDIPTGSTVGTIMAAIVGCPTVDVGISAWAMHSIRETIASQDEATLCELLKSVFQTGIFDVG